jgi:putative Mg2+ transporter-C (MgtC) family protein
MYLIPEDLIKIGVAVVVGGIIGAERERHKKAVGLRTLILISIGSAIFTIISIRISTNFGGEPSRIAANIVSGIGFLGAGVILEERGRITGLTTAATTWLVAALGMAAGAGEYVLAGISTVVAVLVLMPLTRIEDFLEISNVQRIYEITTDVSCNKYKDLRDMFRDHKMVINSYKQEKREKLMVITFDVLGPMKKHDKIVQKLLSDKEIREVWF